jgi:hypothetical protein
MARRGRELRACAKGFASLRKVNAVASFGPAQRRAAHGSSGSRTARRSLRPQEGPEGSSLVCLTIEVEWLAGQLGEHGASPTDVQDAVAFLRSLPQDADDRVAELRSNWLPYLEARLAAPPQAS